MKKKEMESLEENASTSWFLQLHVIKKIDYLKSRIHYCLINPPCFKNKTK